MDNGNQGLYRAELEKDSCGTGLIANLNGQHSHQLVKDALTMLENMEHRGATGAESNTGDGAGILLQIPNSFFQEEAKRIGFELPEFGKYGVGMMFFPKEKGLREQCKVLINDYLDEIGFDLLGYREVPTDNTSLGETAKSVEPHIEQVFVTPKEEVDKKRLERGLYVLRKFIGHNIWSTYPQAEDSFYICSFSYKTIIYKGQLTTWQLKKYFTDLQNEKFESSLALIHSRFSTNTIPKWKLAQPFRYIAHNGEINTIKGNVSRWKSKEHQLSSDCFTELELEKMKPIVWDNLSDSGSFDNVLEFLVLNGRSLPHSLMMMIPEAWEHDEEMDPNKRAFYEFQETMMEPWDGPAAMCFTDGVLVGATLDRNGLRPARYCLLEDNTLIVASETGALKVDQSKVVLKGRLQAGKMLIADMDEKRIIGDTELKEVICNRLPYKEWIDEEMVNINSLPLYQNAYYELDQTTLRNKQLLFGYSREDLTTILGPMIESKKDPIGSMGFDTPLAVLSKRSQHISNYFKQLFAQVTNPPIDPIRERSVMSLFSQLGKVGNVLQDKREYAKLIHLDSPVLSNEDLNKLKFLTHPDHKVGIVDIVFQASNQPGKLEAAIEHICAVAEDLVRNDCDILILSDRLVDGYFSPIPSLLALGAIHQHLINKGLRMLTSLVIESGDVRETHHFATLIGFGANAINPYLVYASLLDLNHMNFFSVPKQQEELINTYNSAIEKGLLKIMSKIGISTLEGYKGAQTFEILGFNKKLVNKCFQGAVSRIEGLDFDDLAKEIHVNHQAAYPGRYKMDRRLDVGGLYQWKHRGEKHLFNPDTIHLLQQSAWKNDYNLYKEFSAKINEQNEQAMTLRGLLTFRKSTPIPLEQVEATTDIITRFVTGAMSFGSISYEAHTTLAIALNRIGGKSNSGEGGEDPSRFTPLPNGDSMNSATKQVASGRFGVTSNYLTNAQEIQIKMAQGAKPGEGGQLPGHKVDEWIAKVRHSTPGVGLISPPPHHDIYSIEDLSQLIFDLKNANPSARINVKLVSKAGVGIIASGVVKAKAEAVLIAGHDGGTGASPLSSIRHAGLPWELGLAETQQTLVKNKLRDRVVVQVDGQIRTGRDLAIATLLGAEEWGIATAALVVEGCIMMRKCHLNTCPVGIATQDTELRKLYKGNPDHVINYLKHMVEELREIMAELGFKTINEMVGKVELLKLKKDITYWKYKQIDLQPILFKEPTDPTVGHFHSKEQNFEMEDVLDRTLIHDAKISIENGKTIQLEYPIQNTNRAVGAMLSNEISKKYGEVGLSDQTIQVSFRGSAGQSFGAFSTKGIEFKLEGESNDYFGKGLCGARLIVYPDREANLVPEDNIIIGNVCLFGATSGEIYVNGRAGERFAVRNSGASAVVEGVGDHACEYMTGGKVLILGSTGKNFAAGMSGGIAYVFDPNQELEKNCNMEMVELEELQADDQGTILELLTNHERFTNSKLAHRLLKDWESNKFQFKKVMPIELKRVLEQSLQHPVSQNS